MRGNFQAIPNGGHFAFAAVAAAACFLLLVTALRQKGFQVSAAFGGALKGFFLGYQNTEYDENGQEQVTYQDAQEQTISQQDYDQVEQRYFGDFQPCTATLSWLDCVPGDQLAGTNLPDRLAECWQAFSIAADA